MTLERLREIDDMLDATDDPDQLRKIAIELLEAIDDRNFLSVTVTSMHADIGHFLISKGEHNAR